MPTQTIIVPNITELFDNAVRATIALLPNGSAPNQSGRIEIPATQITEEEADILVGNADRIMRPIREANENANNLLCDLRENAELWLSVLESAQKAELTTDTANVFVVAGQNVDRATFVNQLRGAINLGYVDVPHNLLDKVRQYEGIHDDWGSFASVRTEPTESLRITAINLKHRFNQIQSLACLMASNVDVMRDIAQRPDIREAVQRFDHDAGKQLYGSEFCVGNGHSTTSRKRLFIGDSGTLKFPGKRDVRFDIDQ